PQRSSRPNLSCTSSDTSSVRRRAGSLLGLGLLHAPAEVERVLAGPDAARGVERGGVATQRSVKPAPEDQLHNGLSGWRPILGVVIRGSVQEHVPLVTGLLG